MNGPITAAANGTRITCRAVPGASKSAIAEITTEAVRMRVAAPPVEGKANRELERFLAKTLGLPKSAVAVIKGETGKLKKILAAGIAPDEATKKIKDAL